MADPRAKLLHEWDVGKNRYRLIARGKWSAGYADEYVIDELMTDSLGEPTWQPITAWKAGGGLTATDLLVGLVNHLLNTNKHGA